MNTVAHEKRGETSINKVHQRSLEYVLSITHDLAWLREPKPAAVNACSAKVTS
jgi:hypothetical protein